MSNILTDTPPIKIDKNHFEKWLARIIWISALATIATYWVGQTKTKETVSCNKQDIRTNVIMIADHEKRIAKQEEKNDKLFDILNSIDKRTARIEGKLEN